MWSNYIEFTEVYHMVSTVGVLLEHYKCYKIQSSSSLSSSDKDFLKKSIWLLEFQDGCQYGDFKLMTSKRGEGGICQKVIF